MSQKSRIKNLRFSHSLPSLPFLSVMLGLMSVMALATIGISVEQRQIKEDSSSVELVGIPSNFKPFHIRCKENRVGWLDANLEWQESSILTLIAGMDSISDLSGSAQDKQSILGFIEKKIHENKRLSFYGQQNSLILWVEPSGIDTAVILQHLIYLRDAALRIGMLPILENEKIYHAGIEIK